MNRTRIALGLLAAVSLSASGEPARPDWTKHVIDSELPAISAVITDVDGDGRLDVIAAGGPAGAASRWSNLVFWYHAPEWTKRPVCQLREKAVILHLDATRLAGTNRPGPADLIVTDGHFGEIWSCAYQGQAGLWARTLLVTNVVGAHGTASGDIDRDGYPDLAVPSQMGRPRAGVIWARNPGLRGAADLWEKVAVAPSNSVPGWQEYVRVADLNGDGRLDILHGSDGREGWMGFWTQGKEPRGMWQAHPLKGPMRHATNVEAADVNGDGLPDVVGSEGHGVGLWWFPAPGYPAVRLDDTLTNVHSLALADFNGDGSVDVAACGYGSATLACFYNDGSGRFARVVLDTNQCSYDARAADLDGDGDVDVVLSGQNSGNLVWYENKSRNRAVPRQ